MNIFFQQFLALLTGAAAIWVLAKAGVIVIYLSVAAILAYLLGPLVDFLEKAKINRVVAIVLVFFEVIFLVGILFFVFVPLLATELKNAAAALPGYFLRLKVFSREWLYRHQQNYYFGQALNHFDEFWRFPMVSETWLLNAQKLALGLVSSVVHFLFSLLITLVITFYLLLESRRMKDWFLQIVPQSRRNEVSSVLQSINEKIGRYVQAQFLISFMVAGCNVLILMMLKVDYAFVVGTIVGLASIIPVVGSVFGISANLFFGMMDSSWKALVAGAGYLVIQFFTDHFISPQLIGRRTQIHPLVVFLGVLVGAELLGPLGILMAVPVLIVGREVFAFFQQRGFK